MKINGWFRQRRPDETSLAVRHGSRPTCTTKCMVQVGALSGMPTVVGIKHSIHCERAYKKDGVMNNKCRRVICECGKCEPMNVKPSADGYAFNFGNRVKIKHGFYDQSLATVKRVDEEYREHDGIRTVYIKLYGVIVDGDETQAIHWFKAHQLGEA